jgi:hypothetical protein
MVSYHSQSMGNFRSARVALLSLCAVALQNSLISPASGQSVEPSSFSRVERGAADGHRPDGESLLVSGQIRSALWSDPSLSAPAKHIDVLASPRAVILRGEAAPAETPHIEALAREYAGGRQIESQLVGAVAPR